MRCHKRSLGAVFSALCAPAALAQNEIPTQHAPAPVEEAGTTGGRLAVVVPAHKGDLHQALESLQRWPTACSAVAKAKMDLVLYKAEGEDAESSASILPALDSTAGRCFANTKVVYANLRDEVRKRDGREEEKREREM